MKIKTLSTTARPLLCVAICGLTAAFSSNLNAQEVRSRTNAPAKAAGSASKPTSSTVSPDTLGGWLELHGQSFGLFEDEPKDEAATEPVDNVDPSMSPPKPVTLKVEPKRFTPPPAAIAASDAAAQIKAVMDDLKFQGACDQFAGENGLGPWGEAVVDSLLRGNGSALLKGTDDLRKACPNYENLGQRERSYVWVNVFATMAFKESSCVPTAKVPGIKKGRYARGILQLHENSEHKYSDGCRRGDSRSPVRTLQCGISMLNDQIERSDRLFDRKTYWAVLRPQGDLLVGKNGKKRRVALTRLTIGGLKELPLCQRSTIPSISKK